MPNLINLLNFKAKCYFIEKINCEVIFLIDGVTLNKFIIYLISVVICHFNFMLIGFYEGDFQRQN